MDLISIVVPIYNVEKYLRKSIESLINQTYKNIEIILVDDESPDDCPQICDEYEKKDSRVIVIHQKNKGLSGARNTGIKKATGKYIMFHDSDDTLEPNCVEELYKLIKDKKTKISVCGKYYEFEDGKKICKYKDNFIKVYDLETAIEEMNKFYYFDMSACGKLYKKSIFNNIIFPVGKLSEDYFVMYKLFIKSGKIAYTTKPMYNYLQRNNSISRNKSVNTQFIEAAYEQMIDLSDYSEKMKMIVHVAYASSFLTVVDMYIRQKIKPPKEFIKDSKQIIKENMNFIKQYKKLSKCKKIQFFLYILNYQLYKCSFVIYRKIKRV